MNLQAEGTRPACHSLADAAHADDAEPFSPDAMAEHPGRRPARPVLALGEDRGAFDQPPRHRENQRHGHVGGIFGQNFRRVGHGNAARMRGDDVDIVDTIAEIGDQPQLAVGSLRNSSVISSVTVGTRISADRTASAICSGVIGVSSRLSRASNNSRMRVSIESGSLRVTTTRGFFLTDMSCSHEIIQTSLTRLFDTAAAAWSRRFRGFLPIFPACFLGTFGLVLVLYVPSSLAEGRAKTRTLA